MFKTDSQKKATYVSSGSENDSAFFYLQRIVTSVSILSLALKDNH